MKDVKNEREEDKERIRQFIGRYGDSRLVNDIFEQLRTYINKLTTIKDIYEQLRIYIKELLTNNPDIEKHLKKKSQKES